MIKVNMYTKLDISSAERWPNRMPFRPMIGDRVISGYTWPDGKRLELVVVGVKIDTKYNSDVALVELHLPEEHKAILYSFDEWYKRLMGKK